MRIKRDTIEEIPFTRPFVPPTEELVPLLESIRNSRVLTNNGPIHQEFEQALADYLNVKYISLFANATLALIAALKVLNLKGEVITTPFTYISTTQSIIWNQLRPVFADVSNGCINLDPSSVERLINPETCAILPVHIFGFPCDVKAFGEIAQKHQLNIIYDAAHAFGVSVNKKSLCDYGTLSILSFHATKTFNCYEGGALVSHDPKTKSRIDKIKNYGLPIDGTPATIGFNAKMNELQAAVGLINLRYADTLIAKRRKAVNLYEGCLERIQGINMIKPKNSVGQNHTYLPVLVEREVIGGTRDELMRFLLSHNIQSRAYFHPLLSSFDVFRNSKTDSLQNAIDISEKILCLPLFDEITESQIGLVTESIGAFIKSRTGKTSTTILR